ncbi:CBS domain-containing protein [Streptomyces hydrogenans]
MLRKVPGEATDDGRVPTAGRLMTAPAVTVLRGATIAGAARLMGRGCLKWLPVVDEEGRPLGVVSRGDLLKVHLRSDAELAVRLARAVPGVVGATAAFTFVA